jgi:AcrR family transcriptional regulator
VSNVFILLLEEATMSTRIRNTTATMRKSPIQARSRATVEAIVEAATHILGRRGWAEFTTNEVAEAAGASIGSLYQYFPNKLSLVGAIRRRHFDSVIGVLEKACEAPLGPDVDLLIDGMLQVHSSNPSLHKALLEEAPRVVKGTDAHDVFEKKYLRCYRTFVAKHRKTQQDGSNEVVARVLSAAIEGAVHYAAVNGLIRAPLVKREIVALVRSYLNHGVNGRL